MKKKIYCMPLCEVIAMHNEKMIAASKLVMDQDVKVDQLSNKKDMWGKENMWDN